MSEPWQVDPDVAAALAPMGSPFTDPRFTSGLETLGDGWAARTVSAVAADGTRATITLARKQLVALSLPFGYGGILAERSLEGSEVTDFLGLVANQLGVRLVMSRDLPLPVSGRPAHTGGSVIGTTQVVVIEGGDSDLESQLTKKARQSIRRARRAGVVVTAESDPTRFLDLYGLASRRFAMVYPASLVKLLAASGLGRAYTATVGTEVVASAFALVGQPESMYWLAAQTDRGREVEAGYPVVARLLTDAQQSGVRFVNLGGSAGLPGVAKFKRRMGGVDLPVIEHRLVVPRIRFIRSRLARRLATR